jgi:hypothetical protein
LKPSGTASTEEKKPAKLLPTPASIVVTLQVPSKSLCGIRDELDSASTQDPRTSRNGSNNPRGHMSQSKNIASRDRFDGDCDPQMCGVIQRHTGSIVALQDQCGFSTDIASDPLTGKDNGVTIQGSSSRNTSKLMKRDVSGTFVSSCGESTVPERVRRVPEQCKAVHVRGHVRGSNPAVVQWERHASGRRRDHTARAATPRADDLDIGFTLLGDSGADKSHEDLF